MPQLDFTLWFFNLLINWSLFLTMFLMLNNYYTLHPSMKSATTKLNPSKKAKWKWS